MNIITSTLTPIGVLSMGWEYCHRGTGLINLILISDKLSIHLPPSLHSYFVNFTLTGEYFSFSLILV